MCWHLQRWHVLHCCVPACYLFHLCHAVEVTSCSACWWPCWRWADPRPHLVHAANQKEPVLTNDRRGGGEAGAWGRLNRSPSHLNPNQHSTHWGAAGVLVGMLALGEGLPSSRSLGAARLLSWLLLIAGVSALASGQGAHSMPRRLTV